MKTKSNYKFLIIILVIVVGIGIIIVLNKPSQDIVCNKPYILVGTSCCLDQNDNSICDKDENQEESIITGKIIEKSAIQGCKYSDNSVCIDTCCITGEICGDENSYKKCDVQTGYWGSDSYTDSNCLYKCEVVTSTNKSEITTPKTTPFPNESTSLVSKVIDGDSIELQNNIEVRLLGINTPERGQPYYQEATNRLKELIEGKNVVLESDVQDKDQYGRLLRYVFVGDLFVNLQLVKEGYATVYILQPNTKYETSLTNAENEAKTLKRNIWKQPTGENICDNRCIGISYFKWNAEGNDCDNLNGEYVTFINSCSYSCDLTSWTVKDESSRNPYVFPNFVLENGKTVTLYTGCGGNTNTQLYWCSSGYSCNAIWNNDRDTLYLRNSNGELVLNYPYTGFS